jgi:tetratricopeptide (TPR) repeat protein
MNRKRLSLLLLGALFGGGLPLAVGAQTGTATATASPADTGAACVSNEARSTVETCPSGAPAPNARAGAAPASHLIAAPARTGAEASGTGATRPGIEVDIAREAGIGSGTGAPRAWELLQREITTNERIIGRMRDGDPRGADYLLRLAETYFEAQTYWNNTARSLDEPIHAAAADRRSELERQQQEAEGRVTEMRENAIRTYARLVEHYPDYARMDEVLFSLAYGLDEMHRQEQSRLVYLRLIKNYPESRFVPHAWLSFAEYYFNEEQDMDAARQFYDKVLETPPDRNPVYGYALYKQAWVLYNLEDMRGALTQFVRVIEFARDNPDARDVANLARQARRELVLPYARTGRPNQALAFFRRYATDEDQAFEMLESLAELYYDTGSWPETIQVYHELMSERPNSDQLCYWQSRVTNAIISSRPKPEQVTEVQRLVDLEEVFSNAGGHSAESLTTCRQATAQILFELAVAWHREAIGTDSAPGTNDRNTMNLSAQLYGLAIEHFPDMESLEFPDISREDWPTLYRVSYFQAELLWRMEDWGRCGPAFDRVVNLNPAGEYTTDAAYAAVLCYNNLYQQNYAGRERERRETDDASATDCRRLRGARRRECEERAAAAAATIGAPRDFSDMESGMLGAFQRYVCFVGESDELPQVKYRRARIYYETNHFEEAAVIFRDIAFNHPTHELAEFAANLYLDSLESIRQREGRSSCLGDIEGSIEPLSALYCNTPANRDSHPDLCGVLDNLRCGVLRLTAEDHQTNRRYREAATVYIGIAREHRECGRLDEVLYNAAINYEAARLLGRAIQARQVLVRNFPESPLAQRAVYLIGSNYHALAIYSNAAEWYERFAREFPTASIPLQNFMTRGADNEIEYRDSCTEEELADPGRCAVARSGLVNAVFFRLGLGETDTAVADADLFARNYRRSHARETSQVVFSLGSIYERANDWGRVFDHYRRWLREYGRTGLPHEVIRAHVQMGRSEWELDERDRAEEHFRAAVRAWENNAPDAIGRAEGSDDERARWLALAKVAASEGYFYMAEYAFADFRAIHFPRFSGATTLSNVNRWAQEDLFPWLQRKIEALRTAETAYHRLDPLEIPQWQIAAAARVGEMYRRIIDDVRSAPVPDEIANDDELEGIYLDQLEAVLNGSNPGPDGRWETVDDIRCIDGSDAPSCRGAPLPMALGAFEFCLTLATRVRWFNEWSQQCEEELNNLDRARYPLAAELRGTASFVEDQIAPPSAVELRRDEAIETDTGDGALSGSSGAAASES